MFSRKNIQLLSVGFCNRSIQHMDMVSYSGHLLEALIFWVRTRFLAWNQSIESQMILMSNKYKERNSTALELQGSKMFDDLPAARLDLASLQRLSVSSRSHVSKHSAPLTHRITERPPGLLAFPWWMAKLRWESCGDLHRWSPPRWHLQ